LVCGIIAAIASLGCNTALDQRWPESH